MTVSRVYEWRRPGCDDRCHPRQHDADAHERYGYIYALTALPTWIVKTGPLTVDLRRKLAFVDGQHVPLSPNLWRILETLAIRADMVVSLNALAAVNGHEAGRWGHLSLRMDVHRLRNRLGPCGAELIVNELKRGYRLVMQP